MVFGVRRYFDVRSGEGRRVLFSFLYVAVVAAAFLLARPIRNALFLRQYGAYGLVYVYAAVPLVLSLFVPIYARVAVRFGSRTVAVASLIFFSSNVVLFWYAFQYHSDAIAVRGSLAWYLPGAFYVWVNCFGAIAPVQAWSFANQLFDTRQARRLFGLIAVGASLGSIGAGLLARVLVRPIGGAVNMLLVLAGLILTGAVIVAIAHIQLHVGGPARRTKLPRHPLGDSLRRIATTPYLALIAAVVFVAAITTQWITFQLNLVASQRMADADALVRFFGTFNFALGAVSFGLQLALVGPALRRFGLGATILVLPIALATGSFGMILVPGLWSVLLTSSLDQGLRFSLDKATYELLYLPLPPSQRTPIKAAIDIVVSRVADAFAAVVLGIATEGFLFFDGLRLGLRGTAAVNLGFLAAWIIIAARLRREYVRTIQSSIHRHRIASEHAPDVPLDRSAASMVGAKLVSPDPADVRYALDWLDAQGMMGLDRQVRQLLSHRDADIRRRALAMLSGARDTSIGRKATEMLRDPDLGVRTEALLYVTREMRVDPVRQLEELGDFEDFSIRAGMAAFLASPGPSQNLDAARLLLEAMARSDDGEEDVRDRLQAARVLSLVPGVFNDLLVALIADPDESVARQAIRATSVVMRDEVVAALLTALARPELAGDAADRLARYGNALVPRLAERLYDEGTPVAVRREIPQVLVRIATPIALEVLIDGLLQSDVTLRQRVIASLNKLHDLHPEVHIDEQLLELVLAAEIAGHYRSYQVLGPLREHLKDDDPGLEGFRRSMDHELERIFRLMTLLVPGPGVHDAYVGVRSSNPSVRENALEYLDNVLRPDLRRLILPLIDTHVTIEERIRLANGLVGAPLETAEQAITTLLASEDPWLRSCGAYAVGALRLHSLEPDLQKLADAPDGATRETVQVALHRLSGEPDTAQAPAVVGMESGVG